MSLKSLFSNKLWNHQSKVPPVSPTSSAAVASKKGATAEVQPTKVSRTNSNSTNILQKQQEQPVLQWQEPKLQKQSSKSQIVLPVRNDFESAPSLTGSFISSDTQDEETEQESRVVQVAKLFFDEYLHHETMEPLMSSKCVIQFTEAEMLGYAFLEEGITLRKCFPDMNFTYESVTEIGPNVAFIKNLRCQATHTGIPYGFGPYPPVEATGRKIQNDPEDITVTLDATTGLIIRMKITTKGRLSGPPGFYEQIGGILF